MNSYNGNEPPTMTSDTGINRDLDLKINKNQFIYLNKLLAKSKSLAITTIFNHLLSKFNDDEKYIIFDSILNINCNEDFFPLNNYAMLIDTKLGGIVLTNRSVIGQMLENEKSTTSQNILKKLRQYDTDKSIKLNLQEFRTFDRLIKSNHSLSIVTEYLNIFK